MSTANLVPETRDLTGDDAFETLRRNGRRHLLVDAFQRLRVRGRLQPCPFARVPERARRRAGHDRAGRPRGRAEQHSVQRRGDLRRSRGSHPVRRGELLTAAATPSPARPATATEIVAIALGLAGCLFTGTTVARPVRTRAQSHLRRRDRPPDRAEVRVRVRARRSSSARSSPRRSRRSPYGGIHIGLARRRTRRHRVAGRCAGRCGLSSAAGWPRLFQVVTAPPAAAVVVARRSERLIGTIALARCHRALLAAVLPLELDVRRDLRTARRHRRLARSGRCFRSVALLYGAAVNAQLEAVRAQASAPQDETKVAESEPEAADPG